MSFSRENVMYKSLPINRSRYEASQGTSLKSSAVIDKDAPSATKPLINTEEFAKLDALLHDLLAEVDQPLLLNKDSTKNLAKSHTNTRATNTDEVERSVDWLNEQKEILRSRKELNNRAKLNFYNNLSSKPNNEQSFSLSSNTIINNKPPVSPSNRAFYTMTPQPSQPQHLTTSFRSLSTNPVSLKNTTETDDEMNLIDSEVDRYSMKSHKSNLGSTLNRSKYHLVSNDFTDVTRAAAPTPVSSLNRNYLNKRALSAPPAEVGKVVLQRMELKSPLTVRQPSVVPFEQQKPVYTNEQVQQRVQTPISYNTFNGRPKVNNQNISNQQVPARSVFLNRAYSETPRVAYTNGYETDSGLVTNNGYVYRNGIQSNEGYNTYRAGETANYRYGNTGAINKTYRTLGPNTRYQVVNDQTGYDTDTGLIRMRQAMDNRRVQNTNIPIQTTYTNRSATPSFNYHYNQLTPQQQNVFARPEIRSVSAMGEPRYNGQTQFTNQYIDRMDQKVDTLDSSNSAMRGYLTSDGRQIVLNNPQTNTIEPKSVIIQQTVAPSAQYNQSQSAFNLNVNSQTENSSLIKSTSNSAIRKKADDIRRTSTSSLTNTDEVIRDHPKSVKTVQSYWYKPKISRDEAISLLKDKPPGTFLIRDSNNFPGAYGLALKVEKPPQNVQIKPGSDPSNELVRHFLIEPTAKGVRIKGCCNEPIFASLAALVHQHSLMPLALPTKLIIPSQDLGSKTNESKSKASAYDPRILLEKGAACNVYYLNTVNVGNKKGFEAITYGLNHTKAYLNKDSSQLLLVQFKVTSFGITVTDINKKKFIRQHFPTNTVIYCAVDEKFCWPKTLDRIQKPKIFGVLCRPKIDSGHNECHLFVELDPEQPAIAIVDFINRYLIPSKSSK